MKAAIPDHTWRETILSDTIIDSPILTKRKRIMSVGIVQMQQCAQGSHQYAVSDLTSRCSTLQKENSSLEVRSQNLQQHANELQTKLNSSSQQNRELIKQICELKKALCQSKDTEAESIRFIHRLQQENKTQNQKIESLEVRLRANMKQMKQMCEENNKYFDSIDFRHQRSTSSVEHRVESARDHRTLTTPINDQRSIPNAPRQPEAQKIHVVEAGRKFVLNLPANQPSNQKRDKLSETLDEVIEKYCSESPARRSSDETKKQEKLLAATRAHVRDQLRSMLKANPTLNMRELRRLAEQKSVLKDQIHVLNDRQLSALVSQFRKKQNNDLNFSLCDLPPSAKMRVVATRNMNKTHEVHRPFRYEFTPIDVNHLQLIQSNSTESEAGNDDIFSVANNGPQFNRFHVNLE